MTASFVTNGTHIPNGTNLSNDHNGFVSDKVIVVGAGPVGLFTALKLAQAGIKVEVIEKLATRSTAPRAGGYYGGSVLALQKAGMYDIMLKEGYLENKFAFRGLPRSNQKGGKSYGKCLATLPILQPHVEGETPIGGLLLLPQSELVRLLEEKVKATGLVELTNNSEVRAIQDHDDRVDVTVKDLSTDEIRRVTGSYLVGADGGKSTVRKMLGIENVGHTWPERLVALDVHVTNLEEEVSPPFYLIDSTNSSSIIPLDRARKGEPSLWRYGTAIDAADTRSDEDVLSDENLAVSLEKVMPGKRPLRYEVRRRAVYAIHQRLARTMRKGRCLLAGDAAHQCNTVGGMGLSTGILDAEAVADALAMVLNEHYPDIVLDLYSDQRRHVFAFFVDPMTTQNKSRIANEEALVEREDGFIRMLNQGPETIRHEMGKQFFGVWRTDMRNEVETFGIKLQ